MSLAAPGISTSSASSLIEESSNPQRKNKRYVKKRGETRKRNSTEVNNPAFQIDEISTKLGKVTLKNEKEADAVSPKDSVDAAVNFGGDKFTVLKENLTATVNEGVEIHGVEINGKKSKGVKDEGKEDADESSAPAAAYAKDQGMSLVVDKSVKNEETGKEETNYQSLLKDFDKGKTEEQKKRDRQNARFAKAVARFSVKFTKAAIELGVIRPNNGSASWSGDSSSSWTDSCSSSCSCSDCCTTESSTCSCSECRSSDSSSSASSFSSSPTSCSTLNSSTSSTPGSTGSSSNSGITSPETFLNVTE